MTSSPRIWVRFSSETNLARHTLPAGSRVTRYQVTGQRAIAGEPLLGLETGAHWLRVESTAELAVGGDLAGVTQHVAYTDGEQRRELAAVSAIESGPCAVLIPIKKSEAWWGLAQDERHARFHGQPSARGHFVIGRAYAARIYRRLYHARYLPGSGWDFLTYFEFPESEAGAFRALLAELRDAAQNPEWQYVEREVEIWMKKLG